MKHGLVAEHDVTHFASTGCPRGTNGFRRNPLCVRDTLWVQLCKSRLLFGPHGVVPKVGPGLKMDKVAMLSWLATRGLGRPTPKNGLSGMGFDPVAGGWAGGDGRPISI